MNPVPLFLIIVTLPLLLGGCNQSSSVFKYEINGDNVTITDCEFGTSGELVIPDTIKGKTVNTIGEKAFQYNKLTSITIPDGVTSIGDGAFANCTSLTSITIPDSVTRIGEKAFGGCHRLTNITIPDGVTSIGESAFVGCTDLMSITIPDGVTSIGGKAFWSCINLMSITIPDGVTSFGDLAFCDCTNLTSITIPDSVTSIGNNAFRGCHRLTNITIPDGVTSIGAGAFWGCASLTSITIPDSVTSIGKNTFYGCRNLTSITIPDSITSIGGGAFSGCGSLTGITIPDSITSISRDSFDYCFSLTRVTFLGDAPKDITDFTISTPTIYRKPEAKGWDDTWGGRPVKLIGEEPSEKLIVDAAPAKSGKKFPSSTKELMFGSNPVVTDKDKAFWEAAKSGNLEVVQRLLSEGVDVDIYGSTVGVDFGCTALFWAAKHNHKEVAQFLLDKEAYIDAGAGMGGSPLHRAAYEGHSEIVELLISEGANAEAKTGDGKTVLDFANEEIARLIRKSIDEKKQKQNNP